MRSDPPTTRHGSARWRWATAAGSAVMARSSGSAIENGATGIERCTLRICVRSRSARTPRSTSVRPIRWRRPPPPSWRTSAASSWVRVTSPASRSLSPNRFGPRSDAYSTEAIGPRDEGSHELDERRLVHRLRQVVLDAEPPRQLLMLVAAPGGQDHDREIARRRAPAKILDQLVPVAVRHLQIGDDRMNGGGLELLERFRAVARSEERRVGKECRSGWAQCRVKNKDVDSG